MDELVTQLLSKMGELLDRPFVFFGHCLGALTMYETARRGDPYVSRKHALGWGRFTNSRLQVHIREGAHFAVVDDMAFIHAVINQELQAPSGSRPDPGGETAW